MKPRPVGHADNVDPAGLPRPALVSEGQGTGSVGLGDFRGHDDSRKNVESTIDPIACLANLIAWLESDAILKAETAAWLRSGVKAYLESDYDLDRCLGLSGPSGKPKARTRYRLLRRNAHLQNAASLLILPIGRDHTIARAERLSVEVRRFARIWPRVRQSDPDPSWSMLRLELYFAFRSCPVMPTSSRHLARILNR